jgi:nicotinate-nucleotide--dimethylbenzimidazole phosphoribosyltransferase
LIPATLSGEPHHQKIISALDIGRPILDLQMRLGEASGAAVALSVVESSIALLNGMATLSSVLNGEL